MPFVLPDPEGLAPEVYPLAWLLGVWRGEGVVDYPGIDEATFTQEIVFDHDGGPYLSYTSTIRLVEAPADPAALSTPSADVPDGPVWQTESGYWRVPPERPRTTGSPTTSTRSRCSSPTRRGTSPVRRSGRQGPHRPGERRDRRARPAARTSVPESGSTGWSTASSCGRTTSRPSVIPMQSYASGRLARVEAPPTTRPDDQRSAPAETETGATASPRGTRALC